MSTLAAVLLVWLATSIAAALALSIAAWLREDGDVPNPVQRDGARTRHLTLHTTDAR